MADSKKRRQHAQKSKGIFLISYLWICFLDNNRIIKYSSLPGRLQNRGQMDVRPPGPEHRWISVDAGAVRSGARQERALHQAVHRHLRFGSGQNDQPSGMVPLLREDGSSVRRSSTKDRQWFVGWVKRVLGMLLNKKIKLWIYWLQEHMPPTVTHRVSTNRHSATCRSASAGALTNMVWNSRTHAQGVSRIAVSLWSLEYYCMV